MNNLAPCPLCRTASPLWFPDHWRDYCRCPECALVHVPPAQHPSREREKAEYDLHENEVEDPGYRRFLSRLAEPLLQRIGPPARGLDFGCGPGPALAAMLEEAGFTMELYDPFYYPDAGVLQSPKDFIVATEVLEHLARPGEVLEQIWQLLEPGGWLGIMTRRLPEESEFAQWRYRRDITHICFFHEETFRWLARRWGAELVLEGTDVALMRKG